MFSKIHGSTEAFHQKMYDAYARNLRVFADTYDLLQMVSEIPVKHRIEDIPVKGYLDFIHNNGQKRWASPELRKFEVLDGKWSVGKYVKKEQLYLYSYLLKLTKNTVPERLGFLDWQKSEFTYFEYDASFETWFHDIVKRAKGRIYEILYKLETAGDLNIPLFDYIGVSFNPSQENCGFCPVLNCCPYAKQKNVFSLDMLYGKNLRRDMNKELQSIVDTQGSSLVDTSL
jgi:hypothetical protein